MRVPIFRLVIGRFPCSLSVETGRQFACYHHRLLRLHPSQSEHPRASQIRPGASWSILEHRRASWSILEHPRASESVAKRGRLENGGVGGWDGEHPPIGRNLCAEVG